MPRALRWQPWRRRCLENSNWSTAGAFPTSSSRAGAKKYLAGDALVAVSKEIQEVLIASDVPEEKTSTIHSGIDATLYSTEKHDHPVLTIGAVGALSKQKGFEILLESLAELRKIDTMPEWQCLIAGDGPFSTN